MYGFPDSVAAGVARRVAKPRNRRKPTIWDGSRFDGLGSLLVTFYELFYEEEEEEPETEETEEETQYETFYVFLVD